MRIVVTGGTGFVGSHCVRALLDAGHDVVLFARDRARVDAAMVPLGVPGDRCELVLGDVSDHDTLRQALEGAHGLLHAANVYSLNAKDEELMHRVNVDGTRAVLNAAAERGLDPIVHVSSCVALLPNEPGASFPPVGTPPGHYSRSKAGAESIARAFQDDGAPVVITNPGFVLGPHQPHLGESATFVREILRGRVRIAIPGGLGIIDIRDVAAAHAAIFEARDGVRRFVMQGNWITLRAVFRELAEIVGHRLPRVAAPATMAVAAGRMADAAQRRGIDPGFSSDSVWISLHWKPIDDSETRRALDIEWRPVTGALRDTVAWLHAEGHISTRQAGLAAGLSWSR